MYYKYLCVYHVWHTANVGMMSRRYRLGGASPDRSVPEKEGPTLPLVAVCAVSSIVLSVRAPPPSSSFSPCFFLFFCHLTRERAQVDGCSFHYCPTPSASPIKKKFPEFRQSHLVLFQPQTRPTTSTNIEAPILQFHP